jgi:hypothetical protein
LKITLDVFQREGRYVFGQSITDQNIQHLQRQLFDFVNGKGEDIKNEIYSRLLTCQVCALEDVVLFNLDLFYNLWQIQANDRWDECKDTAFYQFLHHHETLDI